VPIFVEGTVFQSHASGEGSSQNPAEDPETVATGRGSPQAKRTALSELFGDFFSAQPPLQQHHQQQQNHGLML